MNTINTGRIKMAYDLFGNEDAPVVCLNHCFATNLNFWDATLPALSGLRVLRYDTRGHGASDKPVGDYSLGMLADDTIALLDALAIERVHFCGVSMGGMIGQHLALDYPERITSLALANSPSEYASEQLDAWQKRAQLVTTQGMAAVHDDLMSRWLSDAAIGKDSYHYLSDAIKRFSPTSFAAATVAMCGLKTTARLNELNQPVMIIGSHDDPGVPVEMTQAMVERIPNCESQWLDPSRHLATLEHNDRFNTLLRDHLDRAIANAG